MGNLHFPESSHYSALEPAEPQNSAVLEPFIGMSFPTVDVVFERSAVHTSLSSINGSQPKIGHFSQPFAPYEWIKALIIPLSVIGHTDHTESAPLSRL